MALSTTWTLKLAPEKLSAAAAKALPGIARRAAEKAARVIEQQAPGSIKRNVTMKAGTDRKGRIEETVVVKSAERRGTKGAEYHAVFPNWGTVSQPGQHFMEAGLEAARDAVDDAAKGCLE